MNPSLYTLSKYDVTQKVLEILSDVQYRAILFSIVKEGKTAREMAEKYGIPLSSVHKKISKLKTLGLIQVSMIKISKRGKRFRVYKSSISKADIIMNNVKPIVNLLPNLQTTN